MPNLLLITKKELQELVEVIDDDCLVSLRLSNEVDGAKIYSIKELVSY